MDRGGAAKMRERHIDGRPPLGERWCQLNGHIVRIADDLDLVFQVQLAGLDGDIGKRKVVPEQAMQP